MQYKREIVDRVLMAAVERYPRHKPTENRGSPFWNGAAVSMLEASAPLGLHTLPSLTHGAKPAGSRGLNGLAELTLCPGRVQLGPFISLVSFFPHTYLIFFRAASILPLKG